MNRGMGLCLYQVLDLTASQDLLCMNLMCEKVGTPCICRLSLCLERLAAVETLSLANNSLTDIPSSLWHLTSLRELDLSRNCLQILHPDVQQLHNLRVIPSRLLSLERIRSSKELGVQIDCPG
jgi:hypothetical protein